MRVNSNTIKINNKIKINKNIPNKKKHAIKTKTQTALFVNVSAICV